MIKRLFKISLLLLFVFFLCLTALLYTPYGTKLIVVAVDNFAEDFIKVEKISGSPARNLLLNNIRIVSPVVDVTLSTFQLHWNLSAILRGQIQISETQIDGLTFIFKDSEENEKSEEPTELARLSLPESLLPFWGLSIDDLLVKNISFQLENGEEIENIDRLNLKGSVRGDNFSFSKFAVEDDDYAVILSGHGRAGKIWQADILGNWRFSNWDGGELLGNLSAKGSLPDMDIWLELIEPAKVDIRGKMKELPGNPFFELTGVGEKSSLVAVHPSCPEIHLNARAEASGYINDYRGRLTSVGDWGVYKNIVGEAHVTGNLDNLRFSSLSVKHEDSVINVEGGYLDWADAFIVGGTLQIKNYNPGVFGDMYSGHLNGQITGLLTVDEEVLGEYRLTNVSGDWRGFPVTGQVGVRFNEEELFLEDVLINSGNSTLSGQAAFSEQLQVSFRLDSPDFEELLSSAAGHLEAVVDLRGNYESPLITGHLTGTNFGYYGLNFEKLNISVAEEGLKKGSFLAKVEGRGVDIYGVGFDTFQSSFTGDLSSHRGKLTLSGNGQSLMAEARGEFVNQSWNVSMRDFLYQSELLGNWKLENKPDLSVALPLITLSESCLTSTQGGRLCLQLDYDNEPEFGLYHLKGKVEGYPLESLAAFPYIPGSLNGKIGSNFYMTGDSQKIRKLDAEAQFMDSAMVVQFAGVDEIVALDNTQVNASFVEEQAVIHFTSRIRESSWDFHGDASWDGRYDTNFLAIPVNGKLKVDKFDVTFLSKLLGYEVQSSGYLDIDLELAGNFSTPILAGDVDLLDGVVNLPSLGIALESVELDIAGRDGGLAVDGSCKSGYGRARVKGNLRNVTNLQQFAGKVALTGQDFLLLNLPEYEVFINPELDIDFNLSGANISGKVFIPKAYIAPEEMRDSIAESTDVVFVDEIVHEGDAGYKILTRIRLDLGDDVNFQGYGLKGRLTGGLDVVDEPGHYLEGTGSLSFVDGTFSAYGRSLDIARGTIWFDGGSVLNPGLDVRAQKEVSDKVGSRGGYTVGVDINGLLSDLKYTLYSTPYMEDAYILAYLVFGHSLLDTTDEESNILAGAASAFGWENQANLIRKIASVLPLDDIHIESDMTENDMSLVFGKNITKDFYVGYDYNVRDQVGEVRLRYDLKGGFYVESRSSSEETGADLLYVIER